MKLELGAGHRPTRGYEHNDLYPWDHIEHVGPAWMIDLPDGSVDEVLALAFIEHLTFYDALDTFRNVHRMLKPGGLFLFDVPDYPKWAGYYLERLTYPEGESDFGGVPSLDRCRQTLFGWGRWPGDEHKYGWDWQHLHHQLVETNYSKIRQDVAPFIQRVHRDRFNNPADAHIYTIATK